MSQDQTQNSSPSHYVAEEEEINLLELILILAKHKKMILGFCLVAFVLSLGMTLTFSDMYSATTRIFVPGEKGGTMVNILNSRPIADAIIDKFDLMAEYQQTSRGPVYQALEKQVSIFERTKDHTVSVTVEDKDSKRAADMANTYVEELNKLFQKNRLNSVAALSHYLEGRLDVVKVNLAQAEQNLKVFQEKNKTIRIDDQAKAAIEAIARLKGELASREVELRAAPFQNQQTSQETALREDFVQFKNQIKELENGPVGKKVPGDLAIVTADVPEAGLQYAQLLRDFRLQVTLFEFLTQQHEIARIEEVKNMQGPQVLDIASEPAKKSKPKRGLIVLLATFAAGGIAVLLVFAREYVNRMSVRDRALWNEILGLLWLKKVS